MTRVKRLGYRVLCTAPVWGTGVCLRSTYTTVNGEPRCPQHREDRA